MRIDDVGSCQQVIDKNARNSSSHKPLFLMTHIHKIIQDASKRQEANPQERTAVRDWGERLQPTLRQLE